MSMYVIRHIPTQTYYLRNAFRSWRSKTVPVDFSPDIEKAHVYADLRTTKAFHTAVTKEWGWNKDTGGRFIVVHPKTDFEIVEVALTPVKVVS